MLTYIIMIRKNNSVKRVEVDGCNLKDAKTKALDAYGGEVCCIWPKILARGKNVTSS